MSTADYIIMGLPLGLELAGFLTVVGVAIYVFSQLSKWVTRLIDSGPLSMWSK